VSTLRHRFRSLVRNDRGSSDALGMALIFPAALGLAIAVLVLSRGVDSRATTQSAAEAAVQAAALQRSPAAADQAMARVTNAMLIDGRTCASPSVSRGGTFAAGETISVTISCSTSLGGLELAGASARPQQTYTAFAVVDPFRALDP
jgi:Flp pilus assembly protein TadG